MPQEPIEANWIDAFVRVFEMCKLSKSETIALITESQSRHINIQLTKLALGQMGMSYFQIDVPTPQSISGPIIRSSGASLALTDQDQVVKTLASCDVVLDLTLEGFMHSKETPAILKGGARVMTISNEHPDCLARTVPTDDLVLKTKDAVKRCRSAKQMTVTSPIGTDLIVDMQGAATVGVWGWTDRPGTLAHWPGGLVVSFPQSGTVNGRLNYRAGDMNLTFKRYFESDVSLIIKEDYVTEILGTGTDAALMRNYYPSFGEAHAYATSHVGWGLNPDARYEALTMYDCQDTNGAELRAVAGNFLYSTGANEFANRFTRGHFDLPMMGCDIQLDGNPVVTDGKPV